MLRWRYQLCSSIPLFAASALADEPQRSHRPIEFVDPITYVITQRISAVNQDVSALGLLELNIPIPLDWPEQQTKSIRVEGDRTFQLLDADGLGKIVRSLYQNPNELPGPGASRKLTVAYQITRRAIHTDVSLLADRAFAAYDTRNEEYRISTKSEKSIETTDPAIVSVAEDIRARTRGPLQFARAAYDYVLDHIQYASPSPSHTAQECLAQGKGDCGAYTLLFVAICRAGGVPARPVAGCWALGENQWHCWAEFLLPDVGWIPVDPSVGERGPREREFYFGNLDNNRVSLAKTFNLRVNTDKGSRELGFVQVGTWWWYPAPGSNGSKMVVEHNFLGKQAE